MASSLFIATAFLYALACVLYLVFLFRGTPGVSKLANGALAAALLTHVAFKLVQPAAFSGSVLTGIYPLLSLIALGITTAFLIATARYKITVLGAFIGPIGLMLFLASGLGESYAPVPAGITSAMLKLHIGANALGLIAFALAFGASIGYILQERLLRRRQLSGVFQRLPALEVLDSFSFRSGLIGFLLLTVGMVTGTFWILRPPSGSASITFAQAAGMAAWAIFASGLLLRVGVGWRGRRAAIGTIMGFTCALTVLAAYFLRALGVV